MRWYQRSPEMDIWPWHIFPKFSHVHQIIKFQVCLHILSLIACCSSADTLALEQSKWNELRKPPCWSTNNSAKQRKVELEAICTLLPQETPPNDDDWAPRRNSRHFGRFLRQFGLHWFWHYPPPACLCACGTKQLKKSDMTSHISPIFFSLKAWFIVSRCSQIYFGAGLSHLPLRVERHLIKNFHFPPKMETSPSSPRINQTRGEEKWKCGNRNSQRWKAKYKKKEKSKSYPGDSF